MSWIQSFYKTKNLANNGVFICLSLVLLLSFGYLIPNFSSTRFDEQVYSLNGFNTKHNDHSEVSLFFQSIKENDGFLVLGTSETTSLENGNYYDFLNADEEINESAFSVLAGAGRTCGTHIPILLHHKNELEGLKLIYFINPVYWRTDLCEPNLNYFNRYCNYAMCNSLNLSSEERADFYALVKTYSDEINLFDKGIAYLEQGLRSARRNYFHDLRYKLFPEEYTSQFNFVSSVKRDYSGSLEYGKFNPNLIDSSYNISKNFIEKNWFKPINSSENFRYVELNAFIKLCNQTGIEATYIIGPYNELFIKKHAEKDLEDYKKTSQSIKQLLTENKADFVDATDVSPVLGAFDDHQHHSSYGAYLIYQKIKSHFYEEKNSN